MRASINHSQDSYVQFHVQPQPLVPTIEFEVINRYAIEMQMVTRNTLTFGTGLLGADFTAYATVNLNYRHGTNEVSHWTVEGRHDGFPSFELYVGPTAPATRVYEFDIHNFKVSAADLMGNAEVGFSMSGQAPWPPVPSSVTRYGRRWGVAHY